MNIVFGVILIASGFLFIIKPLWFVNWFWYRKWIKDGTLPRKDYIANMRILGISFIAIGIYAIVT